MATKVQLTGGAFQDSEGNVLASGYLMMKLSQDSKVNSSQICSGVEIRIDLDGSGNVIASPAQSVWGNDQLLPINSFYRVTGYKANGQPAWGPNNQQVIGNGGTFDVGTWVPNSVISWTPPVQTLVLKTNSTLNGSQTLQDLKNGSNVTITDDGVGGVTIAAAGGGSGPALYKADATQPSSPDNHIVTDSVGFDTGTSTVTITLSGAAVYSQSSAYRVLATARDTGLSAISVNQISGTQFSITATSSSNGKQVCWVAIGCNAGS